MYYSGMLKTLDTARLEYKDGVPYSAPYGDIYHSADGAAGQAHHVFLQGCGLPQRWARRERFTILETGFGIGLNFLATWAAWRQDPVRPGRLHFLSVEKHPFRADDLAVLHARWPEFFDLSHELRANWPVLVPGFHRIMLQGGQVQLTLMLGDALDCLTNLEADVDAFFLDGFAPERNADLWQPELFDAMAKRASTGAVAATYTVRGSVRATLARAGFVCEKRPGYGRKRHCLRAHFAGRSGRDEPAPLRHVVVIGAGVAGTATAHALAQRGIPVTILDRAEDAGLGASGNPVAVFRPVISRDDNRATRLTRAAFLHDLRAWTALGDKVEWSRCGVLHLAKDADAAAKQRQALAVLAPPGEFARWTELDEMRELANWPVASPGVFYPTAGWVAPRSLCRAWLDHPAIRLKTGCTVARVESRATGWRVVDFQGAILAEADAVVLANAGDVSHLVPDQVWPLHTVRGQITQLPPGCLPQIRRVIACEGYVSPGANGLLVGATYEHDDGDTAPRVASDLANMARLETILPGATDAFSRLDVTAGSRASLRATLPDRLPIVGGVSDRPGLFVAAGYASRGVVWAGLLGEALADRMTGQPLPLESDLMRAIAPARFAR